MKYTIFWANPTDKEIHAKGREGEESVLINFKGEKISPKVQSLHSCK